MSPTRCLQKFKFRRGPDFFSAAKFFRRTGRNVLPRVGNTEYQHDTVRTHYPVLMQRVRSAENIEEIGETNWASKLVFDTSAMDKKDLSGRKN